MVNDKGEIIMEKTLAVVGAGIAAVPIVRKAKELGIKTIGFGEFDSLAKDEFDLFVEKSIFDIEGLVEACKKNNVTGVIASSEITTESTALLAYRLGLPGNECRDGFSVRNKFIMRERVKTISSVKQPKYYLCEGENRLNYPVVVKAVDACSKRGIKLVDNDKDFIDAVNKAKKISTNGTALVEEYLNGGKEYSVECISCKNIRRIVQVTEKISSGPPYFTEIAHHQPADLSLSVMEKVNKGIYDILDVLGITCGMAHIEIKILNNDIYFIEAGARAGGDHIADKLVYLSTDYDYYKAAIECSFNELENKEINNVAYSGIYFHLKENSVYKELFEKAANADWCVCNTVHDKDFLDAVGNAEAVDSGYIIYRSNHRIGLEDIQNCSAVVINDFNDAFDIIWNHNKEIGRDLSDEDLKNGIKKFLNQGYVVAVLEKKHVLALLVLYCNNFDTLEAYICNVYVLTKFRKQGLSKLLLEKAIRMCRDKKFSTIKLHVAEKNTPAISLYKQYGFIFNGKYKDDGEKQLEMVKHL